MKEKEEKMSLVDFFRRKNSGDVARDRLKLVLVSDRANCSPEIGRASCRERVVGLV